MGEHKRTEVSEPVARTARTAIQVLPSAAITEFVDAFFYDMSDRQYAALATLLLLLFVYGQNAWENVREKGLWFRSVPPVQTTVEGT